MKGVDNTFRSERKLGVFLFEINVCFDRILRKNYLVFQALKTFADNKNYGNVNTTL